MLHEQEARWPLQPMVEITRCLEQEDTERAIPAALTGLLRTLDADRAYVFENRWPNGSLQSARQRFECTKAPIRSQLGNPNLQDAPYPDGFLRWRDVLSSKNVISGLVRHFPASERSLLASQQIQSLAVVPIVVEGTFWGFIGCDACQRERHWSDTEIAFLRATAHCIGALVDRQHNEQELAATRNEKYILKRVLEKAVTSSPDASALPDASSTAPFLVRTSSTILPLSTDEVLWVEAAGNYSRLHTADTSYLVRKGIGGLEKRLGPAGFTRIHRSTLVALHAVDHLSRGDNGTFLIYLEDGTELRVSRGYADAITNRIL